ncbi:hypothetical protein BDY24DRAFT_251271 [Mrakia frigida]|uniref:uncharacterized protein n=1 Tax=Mrakia frigida TaxID=29902 RepID=UPI003FCC0E87
MPSLSDSFFNLSRPSLPTARRARRHPSSIVLRLSLYGSFPSCWTTSRPFGSSFSPALSRYGRTSSCYNPLNTMRIVSYSLPSLVRQPEGKHGLRSWREKSGERLTSSIRRVSFRASFLSSTLLRLSLFVLEVQLILQSFALRVR